MGTTIETWNKNHCNNSKIVKPPNRNRKKCGKISEMNFKTDLWNHGWKIIVLKFTKCVMKKTQSMQNDLLEL